jgi:hypothetical protein
MADIGQGTGNTLIHSRFSNGSLIFYNATTGAAVFTISGTGTSIAGSSALGDDEPMVFGDSSDISMEWDTAGTDAFRVTPASADSAWEFGDGTAANRMDVKFWGSDTTNNVTVDASADTIISTGIHYQFKDNAELRFGTGAGVAADFQIGFDGTRLDIDPQTDDLLIRSGVPAATQKSPDWRFHGNAANGADYMEIDASDSAVRMAGAMELELSRASMQTVTAKTSDYTVTSAETGTIFHTTGASSTVSFTLPTPAAGLWYRFFNAVDSGMRIASASANQIITFNTLEAEDVRFYTANQLAGAYVEAFGLSASKWFLIPHTARTMNTVTITA